MSKEDLGALFKLRHVAGSGIEIVDFIPTMTNFGGGSNGDTSQAVSFANKYEISGYTDWVLPNRLVLLALYDTGLSLGEGFYWSSSNYKENSGCAWGVSFHYGNVSCSERYHDHQTLLIRSSQQTNIINRTINCL